MWINENDACVYVGYTSDCEHCRRGRGRCVYHMNIKNAEHWKEVNLMVRQSCIMWMQHQRSLNASAVKAHESLNGETI